MVESLHGLDLVDSLIDNTRPASGGAYTSVGNYPRQELEAMVVELSRQSGQSVPELLKAFGSYLFGRLMRWHPAIAGSVSDPLALMASIEQHIHVEVRKLYPDAELPTFLVISHTQNRLEMDYASASHMEDLAEGLMQGCLDYFKRAGTIRRKSQPDGKERFIIELEAVAG